jgi:beta/gamma crystallin
MDKKSSCANLFLLSGLLVISVASSLSGTAYPTMTNSTSTNSSTANLGDITTEAFTDSNFSGNSTAINENVPLLEDPFQDSISSMIFSEEEGNSSGYMIEICEHKSYAGNCMILGPGEHDIQTLDWLHDQISSIRYLTPQTVELKNISAGEIFNGSS